ncbi:PilZ domain-containing protein [Sphingomonas palmae]|uniref:PilZ domain-containing protein n=1 Tax=Sphingomonas palmae TaxID=1855283 RepID=A0A1H7GLI8_9SPHN|nr:PilZ domain-containing protein [Sphingomonas palmae]SEK37380.1 PilZ domain-containing protein [Sphingomonas palmae]
MATFAAEFEPAQTQGRRRSPRAPVSFDARLGGQGGMGRTLCKVVDLSLHGCRLQTYSAMKRGQTIWLNLPQIGPIAADVMWADDFTAGCQFHAPLNETAFDELVERFA